MSQRLLITGANRGIGLEMTRQAAVRGDRVTAAILCQDRSKATFVGRHSG